MKMEENKYESVCILKGSLTEEQAKETFKKFKDFLDKNAKNSNVDFLGKQHLSIETKKEETGYFTVFEFEGKENQNLINDLEELYKSDNNVLSFVNGLNNEINITNSTPSITQENRKQEIESNKEYELNDGLPRNGFILEYKDNLALIKINNEYVVARGPELTEDGKLEWASGSYYNNLSIAARRFESRTLDRLDNINVFKELLNEEAHEIYTMSVISNELRNGLPIEQKDLDKLDRMYNKYIDSNDIQLISDDFYDMSTENIAKEVLEESEEEV